MATKVNLKNTIQRQVFLIKKSDSKIEDIADKTKVFLIRNWIRGLGGNGVSLQRPRISEKYKKFKVKKGQPGMIDMVLNGDMSRSMEVKKKGINKYTVGFPRDEEKKAKGNYKRRPQFMKLNKRFKRLMLIDYLKALRAA